MSGRLAGRRAVVTGAASGIGAATVARLRVDGAEVIAVDLTGDGLIADVSTDDGIAAIVAACEGRLDILINNAGVCPVGPAAELADADWRRALEINVTAPFRLSRALVPLLARSKAGRIVNTGSLMSSYGNATLAAYSASKHAVLGLTRALANDFGPMGITVNCIQPGCIVTGMTAALLEDPAAVAYYTERSPLGRLGLPEDIADVFAFLVSDDARFITGQGITVDGGVMSHG
ncbi:SDR family oxidoreductase [Sphingosinicellaceae bacterium]|nr:SDR family oxidoreductase [Sphingosinicellaceae bacterium]